MKVTFGKVIEALTLPITYGFRRIHRESHKEHYDVLDSKNTTVTYFFNGVIRLVSWFAGMSAFSSFGAGLGTAAFPGPGTVVGAIAGGVFGWMIGDRIGKVINISNLPRILTNASLFGGGFAGALNGFASGSMAGAVLLPFPGGAMLGGVFGAIGGATLVGGLASSATAFGMKHIYRLGRAIFNTDAINITNPDKYQVVPHSEVDDGSGHTFYKKELYAPKKSPFAFLFTNDKKSFMPLEFYPDVQQTRFSHQQLKDRNDLLADCYEWKKKHLGVWAVTKFFWSEHEKAANHALNNLVAELHDLSNDQVVSSKEVNSRLSKIHSIRASGDDYKPSTVKPTF